jgi:pimeloyl-ACP methyl ester carboxylesterase
MRLADINRRWAILLFSLAVTLPAAFIAGACVHFAHPRAIPEPIGKPLPHIEPAAWDARGTIVESEPMVLAGADPGALAKVGGARKAVYRSVSAIDGQGTEVSGTFFVPKGDPPKGGWPVISFGHGATGMTPDCGPSAYPDLKGYASAVAAVVQGGFAVAFTDYQGLGHPGVHPFLEPRTAGFNVIDAVRALRAQFPGVSTRWMAVGGSQGGQASWAANEYARDYAGDLNLVGSVAMAPAADVSGLADAARLGTLTKTQIAYMPLVISGMEVIDPSLVESDYLRGPAEDFRQQLISCAPDRDALYSQLDIEQVRPASPEADQRLSAVLKDNALPQRTLSAPMLVMNGSDDDLILSQWVTAAVSRACNLGGMVEHKEVHGKGHTDLDPGDDGLHWMADRFAGKSPPTTCVADR